MLNVVGKTILGGWLFATVFAIGIVAQKPIGTPNEGEVRKTAEASFRPQVKQIDAVTLGKLLQPHGKPLLINFWATWCDPCREEFPDLVKLNKEYSGKIDFITISLDELAEIDKDVPKFLFAMKADMPAYLLKTTEENDVISSVSKDWKGGLPFTILYNEKRDSVYTRQGKVKLDELRGKLDLLLGTVPAIQEVKH